MTDTTGRVGDNSAPAKPLHDAHMRGGLSYPRPQISRPALEAAARQYSPLLTGKPLNTHDQDTRDGLLEEVSAVLEAAAVFDAAAPHMARTYSAEEWVLPVFESPTSPARLVATLARVPSIRSYGSVTHEIVHDEFLGRDMHEVRIVTGGWSENETLISQLRRTLFHFAWWDSIHKGGLFVYKIPTDSWHALVDRLTVPLDRVVE